MLNTRCIFHPAVLNGYIRAAAPFISRSWSQFFICFFIITENEKLHQLAFFKFHFENSMLYEVSKTLPNAISFFKQAQIRMLIQHRYNSFLYKDRKLISFLKQICECKNIFTVLKMSVIANAKESFCWQNNFFLTQHYHRHLACFG